MARFLHLIRMSIFISLLFFSFSVSVSGHGDTDDEEQSEQITDLRSKSLILVKIWCLILVFVGTFVGGISPYFFKWNEGFLTLGTYFAGGVFLGTSMMHFLSDSNESFSDLTEKEYPFAFMLASAGFLMTMLADCTILYVYSKRDVVDVEVEASFQQSRSGFTGGHSQSSNQVNRGMEIELAKPPLAVASSLSDSILLIVALCFHSVFEGIAIGVAGTAGDAWRALWTISLHKIFAAIAMGIALLRMIPERPLLSCMSYAFAFAVSSPIGVAIGIIIDATTQGRVADWIYAISMGLASGVFIYVSINHLLSKGFAPQAAAASTSQFHRCLAATLGVAVIAVVMIWD